MVTGCASRQGSNFLLKSTVIAYYVFGNCNWFITSKANHTLTFSAENVYKQQNVVHISCLLFSIQCYSKRSLHQYIYIKPLVDSMGDSLQMR